MIVDSQRDTQKATLRVDPGCSPSTCTDEEIIGELESLSAVCWWKGCREADSVRVYSTIREYPGQLESAHTQVLLSPGANVRSTAIMD